MGPRNNITLAMIEVECITGVCIQMVMCMTCHDKSFINDFDHKDVQGRLRLKSFMSIQVIRVC